MVQQLYDEPRTLNLQTSYEALHAKVQRMVEMSRTATLTEKKAICQTLNKEMESYPFLLSGQQVLLRPRPQQGLGSRRTRLRLEPHLP